jgi:EAL domain-containing protein (putative c-di-GMP-specific phosphodiesterase class I)/ActR/RegA family two-component response regulator
VTSPRLLIVDDDEHVRRTVQWALEDIASCEAAPDLETAVEILSHRTIDLALIDVRLQRASGLDLLNQLRTHWPATTAVMISGVDDLDVAQDAMARGAASYLVKPLRINDLRIHVSCALAAATRSTAEIGVSARARVLRDLTELLAGHGSFTCAVVNLDHIAILNAAYGPEALSRAHETITDRIRDFDPRVRFLGETRAGSLAVALLVAHPGADIDLAQQLYQHFCAPVVFDGRQLPIQPRIGLTRVAPDDDASAVIGRSEGAAATAAAQHLAVFLDDTAAWQLTRTNLDLLADLSLAISTNQIHVVYQPQFDLNTQLCVGFEALARWHHPQRGTVPPSLFIPLAEDSGLIEQLGTQILQAACRDLSTLPRTADHPLRVSVNVCVAQLRRDDFVKRVEVALKTSSLEPSRLRLEITESAELDQSPEIDQRLHGLTDLGTTLSLDDFGTGYASFAHLARIPWSELKIDGALTRRCEQLGDRAIVKAIIAMANALQIDTIAEGIETEQQLRTLRSLGCHYAQGYLLGRPEPLNLLAHHHGLRSTVALPVPRSGV